MTAGFGAVLTALAFLLIVGLVVVSVLTVGDGGGPIRKTRVDRFAARQVLPITPVNGEQVVRALGITHRWRRLGLMSGFAVAATVAAMQARIEVNFLAMFLGWFVGAVIAEWRISAPSGGGTVAPASGRSKAIVVAAKSGSVANCSGRASPSRMSRADVARRISAPSTSGRSATCSASPSFI